MHVSELDYMVWDKKEKMATVLSIEPVDGEKKSANFFCRKESGEFYFSPLFSYYKCLSYLLFYNFRF
jgi:hypothetical protein